MPDQTFYLTFGSGYAHADYWVRIVAPNEGAARKAAFHHFGPKWSMIRNRINEGHFPGGELFAFHTDEDLNHRKIEA